MSAITLLINISAGLFVIAVGIEDIRRGRGKVFLGYCFILLGLIVALPSVIAVLKS